MPIVSPRDLERIRRLIRKVHRDLAFESMGRDDGAIDLKLSLGRMHTTTQITSQALEASETDAAEFERLRGKIKRVYDRMRAPEMPKKLPKAEIQKDVSFGYRPSFRGRR